MRESILLVVACAFALQLAPGLAWGAPQAGVGEGSPAAGEVVPPTSKCSRDRRLPGNIKYAVLPVDGVIGDSTVTDAIEGLLKGTPASRGVNALVLQFNTTGGSHADVTALAAEIIKVRKKMPVIGLFGSSSGPGAILPVICDYLVVLNPTAGNSVIEWTPGHDLSGGDIVATIKENMGSLVASASDRPLLKSILQGLTDPTVDLFVWRGVDGCPEAGNSAPAGSDAVQLSSGKDSVTGMTGEQLVRSGIAIGVQGSIEQVGTALGVKAWSQQVGVGEAILREVKEARQKEEAKAHGNLREGFAAIKAARNLVGALIEQESIARESDPRRRSNLASYSRSWTSGGWTYSSGGTYAWRKNCDAAIDAWGMVLNFYQQADAATRRAKELAASAAASPCIASDPEFAGDVKALQGEVDALMAQAGSLTIKGQNAQQSIAWLRANYNNPVR